MTFLAFTAMDVRERYNGKEKEIGRGESEGRRGKVRSGARGRARGEERKADRADAF